MASTTEVARPPWAPPPDAETLKSRTSELLTSKLRTAPRRKLTNKFDYKEQIRVTPPAADCQIKAPGPQISPTLKPSVLTSRENGCHLPTDSPPSAVSVRVPMCGYMPGTPFEARKPPLWRYVQTRRIFVDEAKELFYVLLHEDEPVLNDIVREMDAFRRSAVGSTGRQATFDDFCEGETLVSAPLVPGLSTKTQCRARVMRIYSETDVEVFYIDYGFTQRVALKDLRLLTAVKLLKVCQLAIPCQLSRSLKQAGAIGDIQQTKNIKLMFSDEDGNNSVNNSEHGDSNTNCDQNRNNPGRSASATFYYIKDMLPRPASCPFTASS